MIVTSRRARRPAGTRRGMTMVEVCISLVILLVAIGGTLGTISSHLMLGASARETGLAYLEAQRVVERLKAEDFALLFARYNGTRADDPGGVASPGEGFEIDGLTPWDGDADGRVGRILFPTEDAAPAVLREDIVFNGRTLDLNADGSSDAGDRSGDYAVLPVRVRVEWKGRSGNRYVEVQTTLLAP
jgi:hypothetical protein